MAPEEHLEKLERENALLRAENDELRRKLKVRGPFYLPWWARAWRWLVSLPRVGQRRRFAARLKEHDAATEHEHQSELQRHMVGDDV